MSDNYFSHEQILDLKNKLDYRKYYRQFLQLSNLFFKSNICSCEK